MSSSRIIDKVEGAKHRLREKGWKKDVLKVIFVILLSTVHGMLHLI